MAVRICLYTLHGDFSSMVECLTVDQETTDRYRYFTQWFLSLKGRIPVSYSGEIGSIPTETSKCFYSSVGKIPVWYTGVPSSILGRSSKNGRIPKWLRGQFAKLLGRNWCGGSNPTPSAKCRYGATVSAGSLYLQGWGFESLYRY